MDKKMKKSLLICIIILSISFSLYSANKIDDLSFTNADITQVLKTISEIFGITIVPDRDVQGQVTRYFKDTNLTETLTLLLDPLGFVYEVKDNIYFVRKKTPYNITYDPAGKIFNIDANNASLQELVDKMSSFSKETIVFEGDRNDMVSIHVFNKGLIETLTLLTSSLNYSISTDKGIYYAKKKIEENVFDITKDVKKIIINGTEDKITIKVYNQASKDIILSLFSKFQKQLGLLSNNSSVIPFLDVSNISFNSLLDIILTFSYQSYTVDSGRYFIYNAQVQNQTGKYTTVASYKLKNMNYKNFPNIVPQQLIPPNAYKIDNESNSVTFFGSPTEVQYYTDIVKKIDLDRVNYALRVFKLKYLDVKNIKKYLPSKFQNIEMSMIDELNTFSVFMNSEDYDDLYKYISNIDLPVQEYKYKFKYIKPEDVLKSLIPPNINKAQIIMSQNDSSLIFIITEDAKNDLFKYFDTIDVPTPIIRYQLLIVEYQHSNTFKFDYGASVGYNSNPLSYFTSGYGNVFQDQNKNKNDLFSANFDMQTVFGFYFSAYLEYQLLEQKAKIQMSTEVYGISGELVTMTNTKTLQYKDYVTDSNNNKKPVYGSTTFGLNLEIKGRATSSEEVFLEVSARISDQYGATKGAGEAPDTSEKTLKNSIRTKTGKPIVLGGLISKKEDTVNKKIPGLGNIPYVENAFKTYNNLYQDSEFVIYIIPFLQKTEEELRKERIDFVKEIYDEFCKDIVNAPENQ
jgi:general secretion pathway protein D